MEVELRKGWNGLNKKVSHFTLKMKTPHSFANLDNTNQMELHHIPGALIS